MNIYGIVVYDPRKDGPQKERYDFESYSNLPLDRLIEVHNTLSGRVLSSPIEGGITFDEFLHGEHGYLNQHTGVLVIDGMVVQTYDSLSEIPLCETLTSIGRKTNSIPFVYSVATIDSPSI